MEGLRALSVLACAVAIELMTKVIAAARRRSSACRDEMLIEDERLARQLAGPEGRVVVGRRGWG